MLDEICDSFMFKDDCVTRPIEDGVRYVTFQYRSDNEKDMAIKCKIEKLINDSYNKCENCIHCEYEGAFCGYCAPYCNIDRNNFFGDSTEEVNCEHYERNTHYCEEYWGEN